jgi:hypothetical protein
MRWRNGLIVVLVLVVAGCMSTPRAKEGGFTSPDPASRMYAITLAGETRDRTAIPHLIELLSSDDPAERMLSIEALKKMTDDHHGYDPYALPHKRHIAIEKWQQAYHTGAVENQP